VALNPESEDNILLEEGILGTFFLKLGSSSNDTSSDEEEASSSATELFMLSFIEILNPEVKEQTAKLLLAIG